MHFFERVCSKAVNVHDCAVQGAHLLGAFDVAASLRGNMEEKGCSVPSALDAMGVSGKTVLDKYNQRNPKDQLLSPYGG